MSTHKFYSKYKKSKKEHIADKSIPLLIDCLLKELNPKDNTCLFLKSLHSFYEEFGGLTLKQFNALKDVKEVFLERTSAEHEQWKNEYNEEKEKLRQYALNITKQIRHIICL